ncbi:MAG: hypothetical protein VB934_14565, partial [Polyangiaceae bacterium]
EVTGVSNPSGYVIAYSKRVKVDGEDKIFFEVWLQLLDGSGSVEDSDCRPGVYHKCMRGGVLPRLDVVYGAENGAVTWDRSTIFLWGWDVGAWQFTVSSEMKIEWSVWLKWVQGGQEKTVHDQYGNALEIGNRREQTPSVVMLKGEVHVFFAEYTPTHYFLYSQQPASSNGIWGWRWDLAKTGGKYDGNGLPIDKAAMWQPTAAPLQKGLAIPSSAATSDRFAVAWSQFSTGGKTHIVQRIGTALDEVDGRGVISTRRNHQQDLALATGEPVLAVWREDRADVNETPPASRSHTNIYARALSASGEPSGEVLALSDEPNNQVAPSVAAGPGGWLVAWLSEDDTATALIEGTAVGQVVLRHLKNVENGPVEPPAPLRVPLTNDAEFNHRRPVVVFDGKSYALFYSDVANGNSRLVRRRVTLKDRRAVHVGEEQLDVGEEEVVATGQSEIVVWDVTVLGGKTLVIWTQSSAFGPGIYGTMSNIAGEDWTTLKLSTETSAVAEPKVATIGEESLVVWRGRRGSDEGLFGAILRSDGTLLEVEVDGSTETEVVIASEKTLSHDVAAANDGHNFVVVWERSPNGLWRDLSWSRVRRDGAVAATASVSLASDATPQSRPSLADGKDGRLLLAYQSVVGPPFMSWRAVSQQLVTGKLDGTEDCASSEECASQHCVDNYCCDRACDGECESCALTPGVCSAVLGAADNTCFGPKRCDAEGVCLGATGEICAADADCASRFCRDGV